MMKRINRRTFAATYLLGFIIGNLLLFTLYIGDVFSGSLQNTIGTFFGIIVVLYAFYLLSTWIVVTIGRLYDLGWPWYLFLVFGLFTPVLIILGLLPGQQKKNKYGTVPAKAYDFRSAFGWWLPQKVQPAVAWAK
jgi:uncharacterized membrane protein YhaH (DUF805 family)